MMEHPCIECAPVSMLDYVCIYVCMYVLRTYGVEVCMYICTIVVSIVRMYVCRRSLPVFTFLFQLSVPALP